MDQKFDQTVNSWKKFLNSQNLRSNLISASMYLTAWESLESAVIDQLRGFYSIGYEEDDWVCGERYRSQVLVRHKSPFRASLLWFLEMNAVNQEDLEIADRIREHRNEIAHRLPEFIFSTEKQIDLELFRSLIALVAKVDKWWIREIEVPTNPDFDNAELTEDDYAKAMSGRMIMLNLMITLATGDNNEVSKWNKEFEQAIDDLKSTGNPFS